MNIVSSKSLVIKNLDTTSYFQQMFEQVKYVNHKEEQVYCVAFLYFTARLVWNNCWWNQEFKGMVWTTTCNDMPISALGLTRYDLVWHSYFVFYFSGKVHVYLCVETHAGYE